MAVSAILSLNSGGKEFDSAMVVKSLWKKKIL